MRGKSSSLRLSNRERPEAYSDLSIRMQSISLRLLENHGDGESLQ